MIDKINDSLVNNFEDRLFPCSIARDEAGKKQVRLPKGWTATDKEYEEFDNSNSNSIALRTGNGITVVDIDTKDLSLLEPYMQELANKWLSDKATFTVETTNGYHFYFDSDDTSYANAVRVSNFIDIRGDDGCVFCYTEDKDSSYKVLCEMEPLPLTKELLEFISIQERDAKTVEYTYDDNNLRVAKASHDANHEFTKALAIEDKMKQAQAIIKSAGMEITDFENTDGLYSRVNALTFILAMNPSFPNAQVRPTIEYIIEEVTGFKTDSEESKKRLHQIFSTMIYSDERFKDIRDILSECSINIESNLEKLHGDLLLLKHGFNLIIGESKSGKTYTTIKSLVDAGFKNDIIHVDFDRNADEKLESLGVQTHHIANASELFNKLNTYKKFHPMEDKIFIIDSLQDVGLDDGIDTNSAALATMNRIAKFGDTGATLVIIHHITKQDDKSLKIKGNATTISSKADTTILFTRDENIRTMEVMNTRAEDKIPTGTLLSYNGVTKEAGAKNEPPK